LEEQLKKGVVNSYQKRDRWFLTPWNHYTKVKEVEIELKNFSIDGYKIIHLCDIHLGYKGLDESYLKKLVKQVLELNANICCITGDLISGHNLFFKEMLSPIKELTSKIDTYFVVGNHEMGYFAYKIYPFLEYLEELGVKVLFNQSVLIKEENVAFNLVGLSDFVGVYYEIAPQPTKAFSKIDPNLPTILLIHRPSWVNRILDFPFDLALAGHHHGGQLTKIPLFFHRIKYQNRFLTALNEIEEGRYIYICNGVGYSRFPLRLFAPSQMSLITIRSR